MAENDRTRGYRDNETYRRPRPQSAESSGDPLAELARLIEQKTLAPIIDRVFPFAGIADAFAYLEAGHAKGKVVVRMLDGSSVFKRSGTASLEENASKQK